MAENCSDMTTDEGQLKCMGALNQMLRDSLECACVVGNAENIENGLEPIDCEQMDNIHVVEVIILTHP